MNDVKLIEYREYFLANSYAKKGSELKHKPRASSLDKINYSSCFLIGIPQRLVIRTFL